MRSKEHIPFENERREHDNTSEVLSTGVVHCFEGLEIYDPSAPATVYLRQLTAEYCGEDIEPPEVFIAKGEQLNAFASHNTLVVYEGALKKIEHRETLLGLLGHESTHYAEGHQCAFHKSKATGELEGHQRAAEIEADILPMKRMDEMGENPLGMLDLVHKIAEQEAVDQPRKGPRLASVAHGHTLERAITLEQVLTVLDVKHLSKTLHPLEIPPLGEIVKVGDEQFGTLSPAVQQGLLNRALNREYPAQRHIEIQKDILRRVASEPMDEAAVHRQAQLMVQREKATEYGDLGDAEQLRRDLHLMLAENTRMLLGNNARHNILKELVSNHSLGVIYEKDEEHVAAVAQIIDEASVTQRRLGYSPYIHMPLTTVLRDPRIKEVDASSAEQLNQNLVRYCIEVKGDDGRSSSLPDEFKTIAVNGVSGEGFLNAVVAQADKHNSQLAFDQPTILDSLAYIIAQRPGEAWTATETWGGTFTIRTEDRQRGEFFGSLVSAIQKESPKVLKEALLRRAANGEDPNIIREQAYIIARAIIDSSSTGRMNESGEYDGPEQMKIDDFRKILPFMLISKGGQFNMDVNFDIDSLVYASSADEFGISLWNKRTVNSTRTAVSRLTSIIETHAKLAQNYPELGIKDPNEEIRSNKHLRSALLFDALQAFTKERPALGDEKLIALLQHYDVPRLEIDGKTIATVTELNQSIEGWSLAVQSLMERADWNTDEDNLLVLAALGMAAPDIELNLALPNYAFERIARQRDFNEGLELLEMFPHARSVHAKILEVLIEEKASTAEEFEKLNGLIETLYLETLADNAGLLGKASIADSILIPFLSDMQDLQRNVALKSDELTDIQSSRLLAGLLSTGNSDEIIKSYAANLWWVHRRTGGKTDVREGFTVEDYITYRAPHKKTRLDYWLKHDYPEARSYPPFDDDLSSIYLSVDAARFFAVRKLMLSWPDGVLMDPKGGTELVDSLMSTWLAAENGTEEGVILRDLLIDLVNKNDPATAYLHIGPMLQDMILRPPRNASSLKEITDKLADTVVMRMERQGRLRPASDDDFASIRTRVHNLFTGAGKLGETIVSIYQEKTTLMQAIGATEVQPESQKLSTIAFAALAGQKSGSLGVKMLQLAGQYFELPDEDKEEFNKVYDDMKGQTRLQAYNTLKREARTNPQAAELFNSIAAFGKRVGGGSLFTVYEVFLKDGRKRAIGVKNPNAEYRVFRLSQFASAGLQRTITKHPGNTTLQLMSSLLDDAATWVSNELNDADFPHKDAVFKHENDTQIGRGFKKGKGRYELIAPHATDTGTQWVRDEAFVEGRNLTSLDIVDGAPTNITEGRINRDDFKDVASILVRNYVFQVLKGSFAHSDIHPGNFRITEDNANVAILDRRNLIPMTTELRTTIRSAFGSILSGDLNEAAHAIAMHAMPPDTDPEKVRQTVASIAESAEDPSALVTGVILELKRGGIAVPLDLSLLLRNFMSVAKLGKEAGFENIAEAFLHTSTGLDELIEMAGEEG